MNGASKRLPRALAVYAVWVLLTLVGMRWAGDGHTRLLIEGVSHGIAWNLVMAIVLLAAATLAMFATLATLPPRAHTFRSPAPG